MGEQQPFFHHTSSMFGVSGSDAAGNPYVTQGNSLLEPVTTWKLALLGPSFDIFSESSMVKWDKPTPVAGKRLL